jgi:glycosyltransferase involved in cell wall biosynthesis
MPEGRNVLFEKTSSKGQSSGLLKIVFLFVGMPVGGAEDFALGVHRHLAPEVNARFICLRSLDVLGEEALAKGLPVELLPLYPGKRINPIAVWRFSRWLRREGIGVLHTQTHHAHVFGGAAARLAGIPLVLHQQKTLGNLSWRKKLVFRRCLRRARRIITLSEQTRADISVRFDISLDSIAVVPNAIDETVFHPATDKPGLRYARGLPEDGFLFGTVASLHEVKNHRAILEALARVDGATAVFVGDGVERANLEKFAKQRGVANRVIFAGRQRPAAPWFQALDAFILPSVWEGQPLALLQAVSCRLPILASRIEGNTAVLGERHAGLFDPADPAALALLMNAVMENPPRFFAIDAEVPTCREAAAMLKKIYAEVA